MTDAGTRTPALERGFGVGARLYLRPLAITGGSAARALVRSGDAVWLAGGPCAFSALEVSARAPGGVRRATGSVATVRRWAEGEDAASRARFTTLWTALTSPRGPTAGLDWSRPRIMGIVNVTPDSFFDGGRFFGAAEAIERGRAMRQAGAEILDVGGESTRPGAQPVAEPEEARRVVPVVEALAAGGLVSIDTRHADIMRAAIGAGAVAINDVDALTGPDSLAAAAALAVPVVLMHCNADPRTMQNAPVYSDVTLDVFDYLEARVAACVAAGIPRERIVVDPGIGFAKTAVHNAELLDAVAALHALGCPVLLGASRKSFIGKFSVGEAADARLPGSVAAAVWGASQGVQIVRVHDVAETAQALAVWARATDPALLAAG